MEEEYQHQAGPSKKAGKQHNTLPIWGNEATMNLNPLILANIQGSSYFKVQLFKLKTYHEVVDEIYYQVKHMEPWERGSRKTAGQTGMCGGVRGVGAGGIVSTAYCLLYKLYTLKLTRKQVNGLLNHTDSPYIRALGFMYLRYTQPPADLYDWYEDYLQDEEEIDTKAGGGQIITIGQMVYSFLTKLEWFSTLFPRIPVPIQKQIEKKIELYCREHRLNVNQLNAPRNFMTAWQQPIAAATATGAGGAGGRGAYEEEESDRPTSHRATRSQYGQQSASHSRAAVAPHRPEHDDRVYYAEDAASSSRHRRRDASRSPNGRDTDRERERERDRERDRPREKHKKKGKHKHRSRSRSRSGSRGRSHSRSRRRHERKERDHERDRGDPERVKWRY